MSRHERYLPAFILALVFLQACPAIAGVVDTSASGFTIRTTISVKGSPADAYRAVSGSIGEWWHPDHTYSGDARNMSIDLANTGCFCEKLADGGFVRHMTVVLAIPGAFVALRGSWNSGQPTGCKIVRVRFKNNRPVGGYENFAVGFWHSGTDRAQVWGRPAGLAVTADRKSLDCRRYRAIRLAHQLSTLSGRSCRCE